MALYRLDTVQNIPASLEETWNFFSDARNLLAITPPSLHLSVTNDPGNRPTYEGQILTYTVRPLMGIPLFWKTEITKVDPPSCFVDEQRKGPCRLWHHQHHFTAIPGGVEMRDIVFYRLPLGYLGDLAHFLLVKHRLRQIFSYRFSKVTERFGAWPSQKPQLSICKADEDHLPATPRSEEVGVPRDTFAA